MLVVLPERAFTSVLIFLACQRCGFILYGVKQNTLLSVSLFCCHHEMEQAKHMSLAILECHAAMSKRLMLGMLWNGLVCC